METEYVDRYEFGASHQPLALLLDLAKVVALTSWRTSKPASWSCCVTVLDIDGSSAAPAVGVRGRPAVGVIPPRDEF